MKKLIVSLILLALLSAMMISAFAAGTSAVKDYDDAKNGELLYTVDFTGADGVISFGSLGDANVTDYFSYTPSADGSALTVKGARDTGERGCLWGGKITSLPANERTVYTMTFQVSVHGEVGLNNSVGVGGYFLKPKEDIPYRTLNYYGNWNTSQNGDTSIRRGVLQLNTAKYNEAPYTQYATLSKPYKVDEDGFITAMLIFDGTSKTFGAYLLTEGATDGTKASDWVLVTEDTYNPESGCMGFVVYSYYIEKVHATIKNVNIYKGTIYTGSGGSQTEPPVEEPTEEPTQEPTEEPTQETTVAPTEEPTQETTVPPTEESTQATTQEATVETTEEPIKSDCEIPTRDDAKTEEDSFLVSFLLGFGAVLVIAVPIVILVLRPKKK